MALRIFYNILFVILLTLLWSCANQVPLTGGLKDETPPKMVKSIPENNSTSFAGTQLEFFFDEYIQLENAQQKLIVSPPFKTAPEIKARTKSVVVSIKDTLDPQTTYLFNFGDGIADLNEGNAVSNFSFTFSTGTYIDSLSCAGRVINASTLEPEKDMLVMLYDDNIDSLPLTSLPYYITKTDLGGFFIFNNLKKGNYKIFALSEKNSNYKYDSAEEIIAFSKSLVSPFVYWEKDTLVPDSLPVVMRKVNGPDTLLLYSFSEDRLKQKIKSSTRKDAWMTEVIFDRPCPVKPVVTSLKQKSITWICGSSLRGDTLKIWPSDTLGFGATDSLIFKIDFSREDSLGNTKFLTDTVKIPPMVIKKGKNVPVTVLSPVTFSAKQASFLNPGTRLYFESPSPIMNFNDSDIVLTEMLPDSQTVIVPAQLKKDTVNPCKLYLEASLKSGSNYVLTTRPGFVNTIYSNKKDTISTRFGFLTEEVFGNLKVIVENAPAQSRFELTNEKGQIISAWYGEGHLEKMFNLLPAGKYKLSSFEDINRNMRWDTGLYVAGQQPEKKHIYEKEIPVRSNWDLEISWDITFNNNRK